MIVWYHFVIGFFGFTLSWILLGSHCRTTIGENDYSAFRWMGYFGGFQGVSHWLTLVCYYYHYGAGDWNHNLQYMAEIVSIVCLIEAARKKYNCGANRQVSWWISATVGALLPLSFLLSSSLQVTLMQILGGVGGFAMLCAILISEKINIDKDNFSTGRVKIHNALIAISVLVMVSYLLSAYWEQFHANTLGLLWEGAPFTASALIAILAISVLWSIPQKEMCRSYADLHGLRSLAPGTWYMPAILVVFAVIALIVVGNESPDISKYQQYHNSASRFENYATSNGVFSITQFAAIGIFGFTLLQCLKIDANRRLALWSRAAIRQYGRRFLKRSNSLYVILDSRGKILLINEKGLKEFQLPKAEILGMPFPGLWQGEGHAKIAGLVNLSLRGKWAKQLLNLPRNQNSSSRFAFSFLPIKNTTGDIWHVVIRGQPTRMALT